MKQDHVDRCVRLLQGLVNGSDPLPLPYPQKLSFPNNPASIFILGKTVAELVWNSGLLLTELELRQLLFKVAAWCSRVGRVEGLAMLGEIHRAGFAIELTLAKRPGWVSSRAGVPWALKFMKQWSSEHEQQLRQEYARPPFIANLDDGFCLVELTNASHVQTEGNAVGHCMSSSFNVEALRKHGFPTGVDAPECLTYAVKLRSHELRIFSVRDPEDKALMTIAYDCHEQSVSHLQNARGDGPRTQLRCSALHEICKLLNAGVSAPVWIKACQRGCPRQGWCKRSVPIPALALQMLEEKIRVFLARRAANSHRRKMRASAHRTVPMGM